MILLSAYIKPQAANYFILYKDFNLRPINTSISSNTTQS